MTHNTERRIGEIFLFGRDYFRCVEAEKGKFACEKCALFENYECTKYGTVADFFGPCCKMFRWDNKQVRFEYFVLDI